MSEPLTRLADLPSAEPDSARAERIRVRCRTRLGRQAQRASASRGAASGGGTVPIWQPLMVILGVGYMTEVVIQALRVYGLL
jgi:hypothetical protein